MPKAALLECDAVAATPDIPDVSEENALATSPAVAAEVAVNVKPLSVTCWPARSAGKLMLEVSTVPAVTPAPPRIPVTPNGFDEFSIEKSSSLAKFIIDNIFSRLFLNVENILIKKLKK